MKQLRALLNVSSPDFYKFLSECIDPVVETNIIPRVHDHVLLVILIHNDCSTLQIISSTDKTILLFSMYLQGGRSPATFTSHFDGYWWTSRESLISLISCSSGRFVLLLKITITF